MTTRSTESDITSDPGMLEPTTLSSTQRVFNELRRQIIEGKIAPGEKLKIESLKVRLNTGTSPIREALSLLTSDQLVERIDQRGFRAAPANMAHFQEILALRCQLEVLALKSSLVNGDTAWEESLILHHHRLSQASRDNAEAFERHHKEFHWSLLAACDSPILLKFCDQLYDLNIRYRFLAGKSTEYDKRDVAQEHKDILDAVLARDEDAAAKSLVLHYGKTGEFLTGQLTASLGLQSV